MVKEGRPLQSLIDEALMDLLAKPRRAKPHPHVMASYLRSHDRYRELYKKRNQVERLFRRLKGFRRIFSRFERLDVVFLAFIYFAFIIEALLQCEHALETQDKRRAGPPTRIRERPVRSPGFPVSRNGMFR